MTGARIRIQGKTYKVPTLDDLSLDDIMVLDAELQERYRSSWMKVQKFAAETENMTEAQAEEHPMATLMSGVTVWMVLRVAGKQSITMQEALSIPSTAVEEVIVDGPKDHMPKAKKKGTRKASAPATADEEDEPSGSPSLSSLPTTSSKRSAVG